MANTVDGNSNNIAHIVTAWKQVKIERKQRAFFVCMKTHQRHDIFQFSELNGAFHENQLRFIEFSMLSNRLLWFDVVIKTKTKKNTTDTNLACMADFKNNLFKIKRIRKWVRFFPLFWIEEKWLSKPSQIH